jgi:hypothetical protein
MTVMQNKLECFVNIDLKFKFEHTQVESLAIPVTKDRLWPWLLITDKPGENCQLQTLKLI